MTIVENKHLELYFNVEFFSMASNFEDKIDTKVYDSIKNHINDPSLNLFEEFYKTKNKFNVLKFREIRYLPLSGGILDYENDCWNFEKYVLINKDKANLNFTNVSLEMKNELKDYLLLIILKGDVKFRTIRLNFNILNVFFRYLSDNNITKIYQINDNIIEQFFLKKGNLSTSMFMKYQLYIKRLLIMHDTINNSEVYTAKIATLCERMQFQKLKAERDSERRYPIPLEYFNKLVEIFIKRMNDINLKETERAVAAILLLDSQTGLRSSELSLLETGCIEQIIDDDKILWKMNYKIVKTATGNKGTISSTTYVNELSKLAIDFLETFLKNRRIEKGTKFLMCPLNSRLPFSTERYMIYLKKICIEYANELNATNIKYSDNLSYIDAQRAFDTFYKDKCRSFETSPVAKIKNIDKSTKIYYPVVHQFRNTVIAELDRKGVDIDYIRQFMGHFSVDMTNSHIKRKDTELQENVAISTEILKRYLVEGDKILGPQGKNIMSGIDDFIKENKFNIHKDLDEIIDKLLNKVPIRMKEWGFCMKGAKLTYACDIDASIDEYMCAYGICVNVCHYYYMIDNTYTTLKNVYDTFKYNFDNGFKRQASLEQKKIYYIYNNRFLPELIELKKELEKQGKQKIIMKHPELTDIIDNLKLIEKETYEWSLVKMN